MGKGGGQVDVVDGHEDGHATTMCQLLGGLQQVVAQGQVQVGGRLVQQQQVRLLAEGAGDADSLEFAAGEAVAGTVQQVLQLELAGRFLGNNLVPFGVAAGKAGVAVAAHENHLLHGEIPEAGFALAHVGHLPGLLLAFQLVQGLSAQGDGAGGRKVVAFQTRQHRHEGGLSAAVGAAEADEVSRIEGKAEGIQHLSPSVPGGKFRHLQQLVILLGGARFLQRRLAAWLLVDCPLTHRAPSFPPVAG